jgi:hypothetical protein
MDVRFHGIGSSFGVAIEQFNRCGYVMLEQMFEFAVIESFASEFSDTIQSRDEQSILRSRGTMYGSRNLLEMFPAVVSLVQSSPLKDFARVVLGDQAGIVRALFFDKPPDRSWSLPWHRDRTIAVKQNDLASEHFSKPTRKAGVPHVEAPSWLSDQMLTLRIHLDPMTSTNGPLCVIPGSHRETNDGDQTPIELHARTGDVLAMRPLLLHSSINSVANTTSHRRIIHLELAPTTTLPDGYEWYSFCRLDERT